ncbi:MAG: hypothetical protein E6J88_02205 [Deltaproteobacteria bacterium]|nr:MAG: hypothetical protein E6J88_02205 [Deltaproteobacteria bacterium]
MLLRRAIPLALAIAAIACEPPVPFDASAHNPSFVDYAVFDPAPDPVDNSPVDIPLPSDVALQPQALATQSGAQLEVLQSFAAQGGWPADQDLALTFDFVRINLDAATGKATRTAPALDLSTINPSTLLILSLSAAGVGPVAYDAPDAADYVVNGDHGTLTIHKTADSSGLRHYPPAVYVAAVRGGANGVKVAGGGPVNPRPAMYLITQGADLTRPENQGLLPGATREEKAKNAAQLEQLRKAFLLPFAALQGAGFPTNEIASMTAFTVTSRVRVRADPIEATSTSPNAATALPFPSDFLFKPKTHTLLDQLTSTSGPFGALGPGLATLDGFSTTALITASTSGLIDPTTVNQNSVFLYEYTATGPKRVPEAHEASATVLPGWAAVSTSDPGRDAARRDRDSAAQGRHRVRGGDHRQGHSAGRHADRAGHARTPLGAEQPADRQRRADRGGARRAERRRGRAAPAGAQAGPRRCRRDQRHHPRARGDGLHLPHPGHGRHRARHRQLLPDDGGESRGAAVRGTGCDRRARWRHDADGLLRRPDHLPGLRDGGQRGDGLLAVQRRRERGADRRHRLRDRGPVVIFNKLRCTAADVTAGKCQDTGAFGGGATATPVGEFANALISVPLPNNYGGCTPTATQPCNLPLVIYHPGLGDSRADMLLVADHLNKAGFVVAAIDMNKHGDRSYCSSNAQCVASGTCNPIADLVNEGDPTGATPGKCSTDFFRDTSGCPGCDNSKAPVLTFFTATGRGASANFVLSFNLFRTRDTFRQDIIDQSQLIRSLSPDPTCNPTAAATVPPPGGTCANNFITQATGVQIHPGRIYFLGQSLGGIAALPDAAANARVRKVALNTTGSTIVDVLSNSIRYYPFLKALLQTRNLDKETHPAAYIQFLTTAKWVLDPADPENFAQNLLTNTIPGPLSGGVAPPARTAIQQFAQCDDHVPTAFQVNLAALIGLGPTGPTTSTTTLFHTSAAPDPATCPTGGQIAHGFLNDWSAATTATNAQDDVANFFAAGTLPPPTRP